MNDLGGVVLSASTAIGRSVVVLVHESAESRIPLDSRFVTWLAQADDVVEYPMAVESVLDRVLREPPRLVLVHGRHQVAPASADVTEDETAPSLVQTLIRRLKGDPTTAIIPVVAVVESGAAAVLDAGADDVVAPAMLEAEVRARLDAVLRRSERDLDVHPSTRLPGARAIDAELRRRLALGEPFAVGYADLDHFKEFNDRYGYHQGNEVILLLSKILHDVVRQHCGSAGFVGHIGGDDFLFVAPLEPMAGVCDAIITRFDELIPFQYSEQDRDMGYFFGKDRRGQLHQVPLMTLSIGVATTRWRRFTNVREVSDLATEMKSFAKGQPGSLWAEDRRREGGPEVRLDGTAHSDVEAGGPSIGGVA